MSASAGPRPRRTRLSAQALAALNPRQSDLLHINTSTEKNAADPFNPKFARIHLMILHLLLRSDRISHAKMTNFVGCTAGIGGLLILENLGPRAGADFPNMSQFETYPFFVRLADKCYSEQVL
jgi:hypothetical protein